MTKRTATFLLVACVVALVTFLCPRRVASQKVTAAEAKNHIGETATVCGIVVSTKYAALTRGQPTFLNLDEPYPRQIFTVLIWGSDRVKFGQPEVTYLGKSVCVTGRIKEYRGVPKVVASAPEQIKVEPGEKK